MKIKKLKKLLAICESEISRINGTLKSYMPSFRPVLSDLDKEIRRGLIEERGKFESTAFELKNMIDAAELIG